MPSLRFVEPNEYKALYAHMERDFPRSERPPYFVIEHNLRRGVHVAHWLVDEGRDVGYVVETMADGLPFVLINYLAVLPDARAGGYGSALLALIAQRHPDHAAVVEVEDPAFSQDDAARSICERRIRFYERADYHIVPVDHFRLFGVPMLVMIQGDCRPDSVRDMFHALYKPTFTAPCWLKNVDIEDAK